jgi:predicted ATPase
MRNSEVPQATLASIRAVVDACLAGATSRRLIVRETGISPRHVAYAIDAARILGLVSEDEDGRISLTTSGDRLAASAQGSDEEFEAWHRAISKSEIMEIIAPRLIAADAPSRDDIAANILRVTKLSESTARHRAAMISKWGDLTRAQRGSIKTRRRSARGMWRRIEIRNYRSIEDATIELAPFTVVVGPNGSGKSNFADALVFARDISVDASAAIENRGGITGVRRWRPTKPTAVTIDIRASGSKRGLESDYVRHMFKIHSGAQGAFSFTDERIEIVSRSERRAWISRAGNVLKKGGGGILPGVTETASAMILAGQLQEFAKTPALRNIRRYRLSPDEMRQPQLSSEKVRLEENGANIAVAVRDVKRMGRFDDLLLALGKIVPGLKDLRVEQVGRYLTLKFQQSQEEGLVADFNATEMSEGALRALGIVVATLQMVPDELLVIEEPEVSIHVGAARLLFEVLKEASEAGAVLLTTHSADLLDAARDEEILVCEYVDGITKIGPMARSQREIVRQGLFSVAELMRSEPLRIESPTQRRKKNNTREA